MKRIDLSAKIILVLILTSLGLSAFAQEDEDMGDDAPAAAAPAKSSGSSGGSKSKKSKRTEVNFEDQLIKGETQKPELFYLLQKKQFNFSKLIKLRENFLPEMKKTAEDIPRGVED